MAKPQALTSEDPRDHRHQQPRDDAPPFKLNAQAREFVPRSQHSINHVLSFPLASHGYACPPPPTLSYCYTTHVFGGTPGTDWVYVGDQHRPSFPLIHPDCFPLDDEILAAKLDHELSEKIINQVEYMFSNISLVAHDSMAKRVSRESEGYVPISVIASSKRVKPFVSNNDALAHVLRSSPNLVVSNDGKKVKRRLPFTEKEKEDLRSRTVVVENLPEDHSNHKLESIFGAVGKVRNIRICHPQEPTNGSSSPSMHSKGDLFINNKLHALVEFDNIEAAENAVNKLNDERDRRKGLRVILLLQRSPKFVLKNQNSDFDSFFDDDEPLPFDAADDAHQTNTDGKEGSKKGWGKGGKQGKSCGSQRQQQNQNGRGSGSGSSRWMHHFCCPLCRSTQRDRGCQMARGGSRWAEASSWSPPVLSSPFLRYHLPLFELRVLVFITFYMKLQLINTLIHFDSFPKSRQQE